ncbi:MAG: hypothetical protein Q9184_005731 [Pyrenodesmia sp. 2 TL-2023]
MQSLDDKSLEHTQIETEGQSSYDRDRDDLARLGKKQVLKRNFGFMSMLGFSCTIMVTWEGILVGGPAGLVYGFLIVWLGTLCVFTTLSELASMAPTAGGWLTVAGWQAFTASGGYLCGTLIQGLIALNNPEYNFQRWHGTLLFWAVILVVVIVNTVISSLLPKLECLILIIHVLGFFAILIPLVYMAPHGNATEVFTTFLNQGGWQTTGLSFFIGLQGTVFAFLGADAAIHMSEEIANASTNVPRSILTSILLNGFLGFAMLIAVLFCLGDVEAILETPTHYPFMAIFLNATQSTSGATAMAAVILVLGICATIAFVATSSRMTWSFARDHGLPFWRYLSKVEPRSSIPLTSILVTVTVSCLLALINIGSAVAFNNVISLTVNGLYSSYLLACALLLYRRLTGAIAPYPSSIPASLSSSHPSAIPPPSSAHELNPKLVTESPPGGQPGTIHLTWGPFRVPGLLGVAVNVAACVYMLIILFFSFWPPVTPTTAETMNYSVLVSGAVVLWSMFYYFVHARRVYRGPMVEI